MCETAIAAENLNYFAIFHDPGLVENRSYLIAQKRLGSGNVSDLLGRIDTIATTEQAGAEHQQETEFYAKLHWDNISSR